MKHTITMTAALVVALAGAAQAQEFTLKVSSPTINDVTHQWMEGFKEGVETRSEGRIAVELYPASQLGQIPATVEGTMMGTIEMTIPAIGFFAGFEPRFQVFDVPGLFDDIAHGQRVMTDPEVLEMLSDFGSNAGVEPLFVYLNGPLMALSHRPIRTVEDFANQRIRLPGAAPVQTRPFDALGASGLSMPLGEVLPSLQNRAIDGSIAAFAIFDAYRYYDVAQAITYLPNSYLFAGALVNSEFMASLGPDLEAIVREEAQQGQELFSTRGVEVVAELEESWQANGGELITFSDEDHEEYLRITQGAAEAFLAENAQLNDVYEVLSAAAERHRQ